jgi:hypothetical protein
MRLVSLVLLISVSGCSLLTEPAKNETLSSRTPLFFCEDWMEVPASRPVKQEHLQNEELIDSSDVFFDHREPNQPGNILDPLSKITKRRTSVYAILVGVNVALEFAGIRH